MRRDAGRVVDIVLLLFLMMTTMMIVLVLTIMNMLELVGKHAIRVVILNPQTQAAEQV